MIETLCSTGVEDAGLMMPAKKEDGDRDRLIEFLKLTADARVKETP